MQPRDPWEEYDFLLHEAFTIFNHERCSRCGLPRYICHNDDPDLEFDIIEDDCRAMVKKKAHEDETARAGGKDFKPPAGQTLRPQPFLISGGDPATLREGYYRGVIERQEELAAEVEAAKSEG